MRRLLCAVAVPAAALFGVLSVPGTAAAEGNGDITVFSTEFSPLTIYSDAEGCTKLPADAHVLANRTDQPVTVYADPFCVTPGLTIQPGYGAHVVPGSGSFSI